MVIEVKMSSFFKNLVNYNLIEEWASVLDWLFDDSKFDKNRWTSGYVASFTKKIKKIDNIKKENFVYAKREYVTFPTAFNKNVPLIIKMVKGNGEGKDIVRHIRNGIAHGHNTTHIINNIPYIVIEDYNTKKEQTAYISFPVNYIVFIYQKYIETEKKIRYSSEKKRP